MGGKKGNNHTKIEERTTREVEPEHESIEATEETATSERSTSDERPENGRYPVQEEADRAYRGIAVGREIASQVIR